MNVLYYYYYLFYTKVIPDNEPHATVIFTLSFSLGLLVNGVLKICLALLFCESYNEWPAIGITLLIMLVNYLLYFKSGKCFKIVEAKPRFFNSNEGSILITVIFFLTSASFLFWGVEYIRDILQSCNYQE